METDAFQVDALQDLDEVTGRNSMADELKNARHVRDIECEAGEQERRQKRDGHRHLACQELRARNDADEQSESQRARQENRCHDKHQRHIAAQRNMKEEFTHDDSMQTSNIAMQK